MMLQYGLRREAAYTIVGVRLPRFWRLATRQKKYDISAASLFYGHQLVIVRRRITHENRLHQIGINWIDRAVSARI